MQSPPGVAAEPVFGAQAAQPMPPRPVHPLGYEPPPPKPPGVPLEDLLVALVRRVIFALGVGLFVAGMVGAFAEISPASDAPDFAGWGAGLIALVVPFPALWKYWPNGK